MTDLIRLATELERSGGQHRFAALINCAVRVMLEHERGVTVRGERWPLPAVDGAPDADVTVRGTTEGVEARGHKSNDLQITLNPVEIGSSVVGPYWTDALHFSQRGADCQDEPSITHAPDSPIPELVREPARRCVPRYPNPEDDGA